MQRRRRNSLTLTIFRTRSVSHLMKHDRWDRGSWISDAYDKFVASKTTYPDLFWPVLFRPRRPLQPPHVIHRRLHSENRTRIARQKIFTRHQLAMKSFRGRCDRRKKRRGANVWRARDRERRVETRAATSESVLALALPRRRSRASRCDAAQPRPLSDAPGTKFGDSSIRLVRRAGLSFRGSRAASAKLRIDLIADYNLRD